MTDNGSKMVQRWHLIMVAILLAGAIVFVGLAQRYSYTELDGTLVRGDRLTGRTCFWFMELATFACVTRSRGVADSTLARIGR